MQREHQAPRNGQGRPEVSPATMIDGPLPDNIDVERFVLGYVLTTQGGYSKVAEQLTAEDFSIEKHKRIFLRMGDISMRGDGIDRVTLANELMKQGQLASVDGLSYIVALDDGLPELHNIDSYVSIVKEYALSRRLIAVMYTATSDLIQRGSVQAAAESIIQEVFGVIRQTERNPTQSLDEYVRSINPAQLLDPSKTDPGLKFGFEQLDRITDGLHAGETCVLAAPPGGGKTALLLHIVRNCTSFTDESGVLILSMEMRKRSIFNRLACAIAAVPVQAYRSGNLNDRQRMAFLDAVEQLRALPIYLEDTPGLNHIQVRAKVEMTLMRQKLKLVGLDYIQLASPINPKVGENEKLTEFCNGVQRMCMDQRLGIRQILLSQLNRDSRKLSKKPGLHDLRGSGTIEQIANMVAFLHYEDQKRPENKGLCSLLLEKNREGESHKEIKMRFVGWLGHFEERPITEQKDSVLAGLEY